MASQASFKGLKPFRTLNANTTPAQVQTAVARGNLGWGELCNNATAARFVKFYDKSTAPVVGTDTPIYTIEIPASTTLPLSMGKALYFANGIWVAATTGVADTDTGAPSSNDVIVNLGYA